MHVVQKILTLFVVKRFLIALIAEIIFNRALIAF